MIELSQKDRVAIVTLARPEKHNAMNRSLCELLRDTIASLRPDTCRAIVVTGHGSSFCSGADLDDVYTRDFRTALYSALHAIADCPVPVIAAVNGPAIGAGTQLAIAADFRIVTPAARFSVPTARIGLAVDPWTVRRLALVAGDALARQLLMAAADVDATVALARGLADRAGTLEDATTWANDMAELAPLTVAYSKRALNQMAEPAGGAQSDDELTAAFEACWESADFVEGRRARAEKRSPRFVGA